VRGAIAISESVAADARAAFGGGCVVETIPNAVDLARFQPLGPKLDLDAVCARTRDENEIRVGLVATFARWKGHEAFLRALASPELRESNIHAYVIGGPIYDTANSQHSAEELLALTRALGLEDRVSFTGFLTDSASAIRSLDVVVHASTRPEPFGLAIAEAMACGRAVVVSDAGGASELFHDGQDAIGTPPGDIRALSQAILGLARNPALRQSLGAAARVTAESSFNRDRLGPALSSFYGRVLDGRVLNAKSCASSTSTAAISTAA
jgi:glycosyltransferase involved in cell wall biosynthesis